MGKLHHCQLPEGVRKVVSAILSSSIFNPINAYLRSKLVYIALPCSIWRVEFISGITELGVSMRGLMGEKSTINLPRVPGFALGTKYALKPYRWVPFGEMGDFLMYPYFSKNSQMSSKCLWSEGET